MAKKKATFIEKEVLKSKTNVFFKDEDEKIRIKVKEIYKTGDRQIHYPFGRNYNAKYPNIREIEYIGFKKGLPRGVSASESRGLGFTKTLSPVIYWLDERFKLKKIVISQTAKDSLDTKNNKLILSDTTLDKLFVIFSNLNERHKEEARTIAINSLADYFPMHIQKTKSKYIKNTIHNFLNEWAGAIDEYSEKDIEGLLNTINKISDERELIETQSLIRTKEAIEEYYIEDVLKQFNDLISQKTETKNLEKKWQDYLKTHNWIFSFVLSLPVILHENEAYVGGKKVTNREGKVTDFLIKNDLTNNVAFVEIKTHITGLIAGGKPYRGTDVYAVSTDLTGAITQVLNQRDNFQKEFWALKGKSKADFQTLNSTCVVLIGSISSLGDEEIDSFELFRSNSKDVIIITFDELQSRIKTIYNVIKR